MLNAAEKSELVQALIASGLDVAGTRLALLDAIDPHLRALIPVNSVPAVQLIHDVGSLIKAGRLPSGEIPLEIYLRGVDMLLALAPQQQRVVRAMLSLVTQRASGAPRIDASALPETREKLIHDTDDTVSFAFMRAGLQAGASIMKLSVPRYENSQPKANDRGPLIYLGTGWMLTDTLIITNHHVVNARDDGEPNAALSDLQLQAQHTVLHFDFDSEAAAGSESGVLALEAWDPKLDYAILRVPAGTRTPLARAPVRLQVGNTPVPVNVIQHPRGHSKRYGIRNNLVSGSNNTDLRYFTDTDFGSSGSPVCNDRWEVVALHRGAAYVQGVQFQGKATAYVNVGTHLDVILQHVQQTYPALAAETGGLA